MKNPINLDLNMGFSRYYDINIHNIGILAVDIYIIFACSSTDKNWHGFRNTP